MTKGFLEMYDSIEIDEGSDEFFFLSNFNKFQAAKEKNRFPQDYETYVKFAKYEKTHNNRETILRRLFTLAMSEYRKQVWVELNARKGN